MELLITLIIALHWSTCLVYYVPLMVLKFSGHVDESMLVMILFIVEHLRFL
jgi:hypothetical protein